MPPVKIVVAPDKFAGTMSAGTVARAFESGWRSVRPGDDLDLVPLADGGPGFVECLHSAVGGEMSALVVSGPLGQPAQAQLLTSGPTCFVEAAMGNGLHLVPAEERDPMHATTAGVGELLKAALATGAERIVVGLGGSATNDGGAGMLAVLGAVAVGESGAGASERLRRGPAAFAGVRAIDLRGARAPVDGVDLQVATDVDNPLLGPEGASFGFGRQKGASDDELAALEQAMAHWDQLCVTAGGPADVSSWPGAGAAGGLGYGLMVVGGHRVSGIDTVLAAVDLAGRCADADLVVTGEGKFDWQSLHGKVVTGVVAAASHAAAPPGPEVVVVCGISDVAEAEWREAGVDRVTSLVSVSGSVEAAMAEGPAILARIGAELARGVGSERLPS